MKELNPIFLFRGKEYKVCNTCNQAFGLLDEDIERIRRLIEYGTAK